MKLDALKHAAIGSAATLAAVFLFLNITEDTSLASPTDDSCTSASSKPVDRQHNTLNSPDNIVVSNRNDSDQEETNTTGTNDSDADQYSSQCSGNCLNSLTEKLSGGIPLDESELLLASDNAREIADLLKQNTDQIISLEASLKAVNNPEERSALLFVLSKLPKDLLSQSAQRLSYSTNPEDRIAGLSLLESSLGSSSNYGQELTVLINDETNDDVLIRAIEIVNELPAGSIDVSTRTKLSNLIERSDNQELVSAALLAKVGFVESDEDIRSNISHVLQTQSDSLKLSGLQAISKVLERQQHQPQRGNWRQDAEVRQSVLSIANNAEANPRLRIEALTLLNQHFRKSQ